MIINIHTEQSLHDIYYIYTYVHSIYIYYHIYIYMIEISCILVN